jgi:hypothetical protein
VRGQQRTRARIPPARRFRARDQRGGPVAIRIAELAIEIARLGERVVLPLQRRIARQREDVVAARVVVGRDLEDIRGTLVTVARRRQDLRRF